MNQETTDWKEVATTLAQRVTFALENLTAKGSGLLLNINEGTTQHWREYMADGLESLPGVKVDREMMHTLDLPRTRQKKAREAIRKGREEASNAEVNGVPPAARPSAEGAV